jgi:SAM-dependent methyltransferase
MTITTVFKDYAKYYDLLYKDKDYKSEADYICKLFERHGLRDGRVLDFGSGTGIHGNLIAKKGYEVTGVELSADMVAISDQTDGFTCTQGDMTTAKVDGNFNAVISLFHVVSYLTADNAVNSFFQNSYEHLKDAGIFVFDVWYSPCVTANPPEIRIKRMENKDLKITRIAEPTIYNDKNIVDVHFSIFSKFTSEAAWTKTEEVHPMRHFSSEEIINFAERVGFKFIANEEFGTGLDPSQDTWGVCFIFKK